MLRIEIYKDLRKEKIGLFFIPNDADKEWVEKNVPVLIQSVRLMADEIRETGY